MSAEPVPRLPTSEQLGRVAWMRQQSAYTPQRLAKIDTAAAEAIESLEEIRQLTATVQAIFRHLGDGMPQSRLHVSREHRHKMHATLQQAARALRKLRTAL